MAPRPPKPAALGVCLPRSALPRVLAALLVLIDEVTGVAGMSSAFVTFLMVATALAMLDRWALTRRDLPRSLGGLAG